MLRPKDTEMSEIDSTFPTFSQNTQVTLCCIQRHRYVKNIFFSISQRTPGVQFSVVDPTGVLRLVQKAGKCAVKHHTHYSYSQPTMLAEFMTSTGLFNPFTAVLSARHSENDSKCAKSEIVKAFFHLCMSTRKDFYQTAQY